jgi:metallo-beta-lactamase family protein
MPIIRDPVDIEEADHVVVESTYGDRVHEENEDIPERLADVINGTIKAGGNVVIPSFAVERAQDLLYYLYGLVKSGAVPQIPIFVDSPMAIRVTNVFRRHPELFDEEMTTMIAGGEHITNYPGLRQTLSVEESKAINKVKEPCVIIAGSGMCTGGRIKHHIGNNIERPESTLLFVGYQAEGTLGRLLVTGAEEVRVHGVMRSVKAKVAKIGGFSGHADRQELLHWMKALKTDTRGVFVTHGEKESSAAFASLLQEELGCDPVMPSYKDTVALD